MRADRLLSLMMLLQQHGQLTAEQLANRLESGEPYTVRFKWPKDESLVFSDNGPCQSCAERTLATVYQLIPAHACTSYWNFRGTRARNKYAFRWQVTCCNSGYILRRICNKSRQGQESMKRFEFSRRSWLTWFCQTPATWDCMTASTRWGSAFR